ncbi:MAG: ABC transporter permease [Spirochaetales bacterium]|nr:ABC transporter permease [Spirochaetales bacterium]
MNRMFKVIKMEFRMTAANKAFIIITILGPFLLLAVTVLPSLLTRSSTGVAEGTVVGIVGADERLMAGLRSAVKESPVTVVSGSSEQSMREALRETGVKAFVLIPDDYLSAGSLQYFSATGTDFLLRDMVRTFIGNAIVSIRMEKEGLDAERISYLSSRPWLETIVVSKDGDGAGQDEFSVIMTSIAFVMLLYMTILLHGQSAARSVLKEKTSKTVEIMLSSIKPSEMLFGKIFGQAAAGLLQYAFWISTSFLLIKVIGPAANLNLPVALNGANLFYLVVFFILAFFIYSSAYAGIGAAAEDESHLGQLSWPIMIFLIVPMVMVSAIIMNPSAPLVVFLSLFPLTAPIVMFERILIGSPAAWEVILCICILVATVAGITFAAGKIFRVGILMTGKRFKFGEILKWVRYKSA